jgi:hypothetical protein
MYTKLYPYEHIRRTELADLEIHEVTIGVSLSMETSPTAENIALLNPEINLRKYAPVPSQGLEPGWISSTISSTTN